MILTPFLSSLINVSTIKLMEEYVWSLNDEQFKMLINGPKDKYVMSEEFSYEIAKGKTVRFSFGICKYSAWKYTGFSLKINSLPSKQVDGHFCILASDVKHVDNARVFYRLSDGKSVNIRGFE
eukprot:71896_1